MSVYSYVELKVHTNVWKVGTHLNICLAYRTYVRWKYTFMFAYKKKRSIYLYIMNICLGVGTRTLLCPALILSLLYYIYIQKRNTLSRTFLTLSACSLYTLLLYTLYIDIGNTFPQLLPLFPPFSYPLLYSPYI